jgi:hypothetical protein
MQYIPARSHVDLAADLADNPVAGNLDDMMCADVLPPSFFRLQHPQAYHFRETNIAPKELERFVGEIAIHAQEAGSLELRLCFLSPFFALIYVVHQHPPARQPCSQPRNRPPACRGPPMCWRRCLPRGPCGGGGRWRRGPSC